MIGETKLAIVVGRAVALLAMVTPRAKIQAEHYGQSFKEDQRLLVVLAFMKVTDLWVIVMTKKVSGFKCVTPKISVTIVAASPLTTPMLLVPLV